MASIALVDMGGVPVELQSTLRSMLAPAAGTRAPVMAFAGASFFQGDVGLRAVKFLDTFISRDPLQKAAFLKDLPALAATFDARTLRYKVGASGGGGGGAWRWGGCRACIAFFSRFPGRCRRFPGAAL